MVPEAYERIRAEVRNSSRFREAVWVGDVHTKMMNEFARNRGRWLAADRAGQCRLLEGVTQKYLMQIQLDHRVFAGRDPQALSARFVRKQEQCASASPLSIMGAPATAMQSYTYSPEDGEPVTWVYQPYVIQIEAAVQSGGSPSTIAATIDAVLASAAGIPDPDLQVVYAAASLALESTYFWYHYENSGGWGGGGGGGGGGSGGGGGGTGGYELEPMSLFGVTAFQKSWGQGAAVDAISCGMGMADKVWLGAGGPVGWKILAGACALYGGGGSLLYAIS
jgi:uncharacterized membrane protein YgcG